MRYAITRRAENLAVSFGLSEQEKNQLLPSGQGRTFHNRVQWARLYLDRAGLLATVSRGKYQITDEGKNVLGQKPDQIDSKFLEKFQGFLAFKGTAKVDSQVPGYKPVPPKSLTPEERIIQAHDEIRKKLALDLLSLTKGCSSTFFEQLVIDVLVRLGYGTYTPDPTPPTHDAGIDGIIPQDKLGLDAVYIQAKKWQGPVGRPEIQKFVGALEGARAKKGIFLTTSAFSDGANDYVRNIDKKVVLIDGESLAKLMIDNDVGVITGSYQIKKIDNDYFDEGYSVSS